MISSNTKDDFEMDENVGSILLAYPFTVLSVWIWIIFPTIVTAISTSASPSTSCTSTCNSTCTSPSTSTSISSCTSISTSSSSTLASRETGQQSGYDPSKGERTVGDAVTLFNWWWKSPFWDLISCHWVY